MPSDATGTQLTHQIRSFSIENFRTFRDRTEIPIEAEVTVFHGLTGSGKSTALAAMDMFFRTLAWLHTQAKYELVMHWSTSYEVLGRSEPLVSERDRPSPSAPTILGATFAGEPGSGVEIHFTPRGQDVQVGVAWTGGLAPWSVDWVGKLAAEETALKNAESALQAVRTSARVPGPPGTPPSEVKKAAITRAEDTVKRHSREVARAQGFLKGVEDARSERVQQLLFPFGSNSRPLAILDARRRARWMKPVATTANAALLAPQLATELYTLQTSRTATDRARWRAFTDMLTRFPTLRGATISVEAGNPPEIVVEHVGRVVLGLDELSSGEQELASLTATLLLSKAGIVAIEEPEMGLDPETQRLWRDVCDTQRASGLVRQIIFESHAVTFDGARVVRFKRDSDGWTQVEAPAPVDDSLAGQARSDGAKPAFVTPHGYTQLPDEMLAELADSDKGARVWFLRGKDSWEAWPEAKLEAALGGKGE